MALPDAAKRSVDAWFAVVVEAELGRVGRLLSPEARADLGTALEAAVGRVEARSRAALRMHLEHGTGIEALARMLGEPRAATSGRLEHTQSVIVAEMRAALGARWADADEVGTIASLVEVGLGRLLEATRSL